MMFQKKITKNSICQSKALKAAPDYPACVEASFPPPGRNLPFCKKYNPYSEIFFKVIFSQNPKIRMYNCNFSGGLRSPYPPHMAPEPF